MKKFLLPLLFVIVGVAVQAKPIDPMTQAVLNAYEKLLQEDPGDYTTLYERAMQYYQLEMYPQALDDVDHALRITPDDKKELKAKEYELRGSILAMGKNYKDAVAAIRKALECQPGDYELNYRLGEFSLLAGDNEGARSAFAAMQRKQSRSPEAMLGLARVDVAQGKFQDAMTKMKQAEELNSSLWTTYQGIGDMLVQLGQPQQAALNYVRAIALADGQAMPLESLFRLASANYPAVKAGLEEAQKKANNSVAMPLLMGNVAFQTGHYADASQALNQVLTREQGRQPGVYSLLAECLLAQGRAAEGVDYANRAVKISPNAHNLAILARTLRGAGNYTEALDAAQKALKASATDADALTEEAFAYIGLKDYDKALASLQKLIAADPDNIYALVLAGSVQDKLKNSATPSVYYSRALSAPARTPAEVALKGLAQLKTGKTLDGDATLRKLIENPAPEACYWAAVAYVNSGDSARGAALARQARDLGYQNAYLLDVASGPITLRP